jgi:hypothetical protein
MRVCLSRQLDHTNTNSPSEGRSFSKASQNPSAVFSLAGLLRVVLFAKKDAVPKFDILGIWIVLVTLDTIPILPHPVAASG